MKNLFIIFFALLSVSCAQSKDEYENDNTREAASNITEGERQQHTISTSGDKDWVVFTSPSAKVYGFTISECSLSLDGEIYVQKGLLPPIKLAEFSVQDGNFSTNLTPDEKGVNYYVGVKSSGGSKGSYVVSINEKGGSPDQTTDNNQSSNRQFSTFVAFDFDNFKGNKIIDKSTDGGRNGKIDGSDPVFLNSSSGRGKTASFDGSWRIVVENSTSEDFSMEGNWTMAFSIYYKSNAEFGNGLITRMTSNTGYCGYRGLLALQDKVGQGLSFSSFDDSFIPDRPWPCTVKITSLQPNKWNRVIIVHRSTQTGDIYINGKLIAEDECMSIAEKGGKKLSIGGNYFNDYCYGDAFASGVQIDDFVIIKKALDQNTIKSDGLSTPLGF